VDITPPLIIAYTPVGTSVNISTEIVVKFSEPMAINDTESAFSLWCTRQIVPGTFRWNLNFTELIFTPSYVLKPAMQYMVKISTQARDLSGNTLIDDFCWNFTTELVVKEKKTYAITHTIFPVIIAIVAIILILVYLIKFAKKHRIRRKGGKG
jgi:hypothetical protein